MILILNMRRFVIVFYTFFRQRLLKFKDRDFWNFDFSMLFKNSFSFTGRTDISQILRKSLYFTYFYNLLIFSINITRLIIICHNERQTLDSDIPWHKTILKPKIRKKFQNFQKPVGASNLKILKKHGKS